LERGPELNIVTPPNGAQEKRVFKREGNAGRTGKGYNGK